jgi:hypothetical protein
MTMGTSLQKRTSDNAACLSCFASNAQKSVRIDTKARSRFGLLSRFRLEPWRRLLRFAVTTTSPEV